MQTVRTVSAQLDMRHPKKKNINIVNIQTTKCTQRNLKEEREHGKFESACDSNFKKFVGKKKL